MRLILSRKSDGKQAASPATGDYFPKSFVNFLRIECDVFARLPGEHRYALAANLWASTSRRLEHSIEREAFTMHWRSRQKMYGNAATFHRLNNELAWFELALGAKPSEHIAQAWLLTGKASDIVSRYFDLAEVMRAGFGDGLVTPEGKAYRMQADAIQSRTHEGGNTRHPRKSMRGAVEIDGDALHELHKVADAWLLGDPCPAGFEWAYAVWDEIRSERGENGGIENARRRVEGAMVQASALLHIAKSTSLPGYVLPMTYAEYPSGRLYAAGEHNLQTCQREVRRAALRGCWDVDVSNCHWALLQQMAARIGLDTPAIDAYLRDKKGLRSRVALAAGIGLRDAKRVLLGLVYGMNLQATEASRRKAIIEMIGPEAAARLNQFPPLLGLYNEVRRIRDGILSDYEQRSTRRGHIVNDAGNIIANTATAAEKLAHVLQGAEAVILREIIKEHGPALKLLAHDGWVMATEPNQVQMEAMLRARTGYRVELEISRL